MLTDRVRDTPQSRCFSKVCVPAKYRSPFVSTVKSHGQYCAEGRAANCFLKALEIVNPEFWEAKGSCVPMPLAQQGVWTDMGRWWACRSSCMLSEKHGSLGTRAHSRSGSLNTQLTGGISSWIFLIEVYMSKVIYFFKASYYVPFLYILLFIY